MSALGAFARRHPDRVAVIVLVLLPLLLFAPALLPGRVLAPLDNLFATFPWRALVPGPIAPNQALGDVTQVFDPWTLWSAAEVRAGRLPLWNPYAYAGAPFYSNPQTACLFPLTWLAWALPPAWALTVPALLKLIAAGLAMYWFLRGLAVVSLAAFVGAAGFMLSTTLIAWLPWTFASTLPFVPLLFGLVDRLCRRGDRRLVALLAAAVALDLVAGYPQAAAQTLVATAAWTLARTPRRVSTVPFLLRVAAGVALGGALAAAQALPALDYVRESNVYAFRSTWTPPLAVPPRALVTALMPYFFGTAEHTWSTWQFNITSTYLGLVPIAALPLAALAWRRPPTRFFAALAVGAGLVHYGALADVLPAPLIAFGSNLRLMPILVFALATLGALGLDAAARVSVPRGIAWLRAWFVVLAAAGWVAVALAVGTPAARAVRPPLALQYVACLVGLAAAVRLLERWLTDGRARWGIALAAVQVATLAPLASYLPVRDARWLYPTPPALAWLREHAGSARVLIPDQVGLLYGLRQAHGYDGLTPRRVAELAGPVGTGAASAAGYRENTVALHGSEPLPPIVVLLAPTRELLGVRYLLLPPGTPAAEPRLRAVYDGRDARVFEDPAALPRAFVAPRARCVDDRAAVQLLRGRAVAPADEALLADCATVPVPAADTRGLAAGSARVSLVPEARIVVDEPARVVVAAATDVPAWLVLTDTWFPGWRARLDGAEVPLRRADHAFRAVALPPGRHEIEFAFTPRGLRLGGAVTLAALALVIVLLLPWRRAAVTTAAVVVVLAGAGPAHAALPAPPFALEVTPSRVTEGDAVTLTVTPRAATGGPWDVYVVWLFSERAAFLGADGAWSQRPVPFRAGLAAGETARVVWRRAGPAADVTLALVVVRPGDDPLERLDWTFHPTLASVRVAGAPGAGPPRPWGLLAVLALAAAVAAVLVCGGRPFSPPATLI
jgi:hypothetical protein